MCLVAEKGNEPTRYAFKGCELLSHNERLYPYLTWLSRELDAAPDKPDGIAELLDSFPESREDTAIELITEKIKAMKDWGVGDWDWPAYFYADVETTWTRGDACIADV